MKCTVKYFDVSVGEAGTYEFEDVKRMQDVIGLRDEGIMTFHHNGKVLQIPEHKFISAIIE